MLALGGSSGPTTVVAGAEVARRGVEATGAGVCVGPARHGFAGDTGTAVVAWREATRAAEAKSAEIADSGRKARGSGRRAPRSAFPMTSIVVGIAACVTAGCAFCG